VGIYGNVGAAYDHSSCHTTMTDVQWLRDESLGVIMGLPNNVSTVGSVPLEHHFFGLSTGCFT